ncbi:hypothetical protein CLPUN_32690 [Clostridium puniceum]|uniref:YolD-like protein n=1 Tax=Clostridium puniceum TaxID=29367 RepID=A0A1S8TCJ5_9CLOT|nr:hypothetical protein [Clostridium puniceum]OOM75458.1 hypothetical protein CLPUN_32690 [Clostridium puniceum]
MNRDNLRKVEVLKCDSEDNIKILYNGYFHQIINEFCQDRTFLKAVIELEDGTIRTVSLYDIKFIS